MAKKQQSASEKAYYASYNPEKQREKRLERHLKKHPNDTQAKNTKPQNRRKAPQTKGGWLTRETAQKMYCGGGSLMPEDITAMTSTDATQYAQFAALVKSVRNQSQFDKNKKKTDDKAMKLGYAEEAKQKQSSKRKKRK